MMSRQEFENGSVLLTGDELAMAMEATINHRGAYEINCSFCVHEGDEGYCKDCTIADTDRSCSCHINPPCSKCVGSKFEVSSYLINYQQHENRKKRWQCFKVNEEVFNKAKEIEDAGLQLSAEILSTGEAAMYIDDGAELDYEIKICHRHEFRQMMCKMIMDFKIPELL